MHIYFWTKYGFVKANYCGKNTHYNERVKRGDAPINKIDEFAKNHDEDYFKADNFKGSKRSKKIRIADERLLFNVKKIKGNLFARIIVIFLIFLKIKLDDLGISLRKNYIGKR